MQPAEREVEKERDGEKERGSVINLCVGTSLPTPPGWKYRVI